MIDTLVSKGSQWRVRFQFEEGEGSRRERWIDVYFEHGQLVLHAGNVCRDCGQADRRQ